MRYYLERRAAQFERKMAEVLMVYCDVNLSRADAAHNARPRPIYTVRVDKKPGVQALGTLRPICPAGESRIGRQGVIRCEFRVR